MGKELLRSAPRAVRSNRSWLVSLLLLVLILCCCLLIVAGVLVYRSGWFNKVPPSIPSTLPAVTLAPLRTEQPLLHPVTLEPGSTPPFGDGATQAPVRPDEPVPPAATEPPFMPVQPDIASLLEASADPVWGQINLQRGFSPDPHSINLGSQAQVDTTISNLPCGFTTSAPTFAFNLGGGASDTFLRIYFIPDASILPMLILRTPDDKWFCGRNTTGSGVGPVLDLDMAPSGRYAVWVSLPLAGDGVLGTLSITGSEANLP